MCIIFETKLITFYMKKILLLSLAPIIFLSISLSGQNNSKKPDQSQLPNDLFVGYGIGSLLIFTGTINHSYDIYTESYNYKESDIQSAGTLMIGYNRMINKVIMIGFTGSYLNLHYTRNYPVDEYNNVYEGTVNFNDNLLNGMAKVTFNYVNKPMVRVYSGIGMGITIDLSNAQGTKAGDELEKAKKILPSGQLTFMGVRFGRTFGGFCEFGFGTNSIINAGLNYQFAD